MISSRNYRSLFVWTLFACVLGVGSTALVLHGTGAVFASLTTQKGYVATQVASIDSVPSDPYQRITLGSLSAEEFIPPHEGKAIRVDLTTLTLELYEDGTLVSTLPVVSKGRPGTPWETPSGSYSISTKEENHFSSIGHVWMPYSMQFFGNFFIHGWPYYPSGAPVAEGYSGGCIRLSTKDAQEVFQFVDVGTPLFVYESAATSTTVASATQHFYSVARASTIPTLSAESYLVADLDTGDILLERSSEEIYPIASLTKLFTALVSLETLNQYESLRVSQKAVATYGDSGGLVAGEQFAVGDLIYPLLLESSNDAAEALAEHKSRERFISTMNAKARSVGLRNTRFTDASGLSESNMSTARDLFLFMRHLATSKPFILDVTRLALKKVDGELPGARTHTWQNNNYFVRKGDPKYLGGKNGYTDEAGRTLVSLFALPLAEFEKRSIAVIVLGSENRERDAELLIEYVSKNIYYGTGGEGTELASKSTVTSGRSVQKNDGPLVGKLLASLGSLSKRSIGGDGRMTLTFVGDIQMDRGVRAKVENVLGGSYSTLFKHVSFLKQSDITFGNLEGPISDKGVNVGSIYSFRMDPRGATALSTAGFDVLSVANNHAGDWGMAAFVDTLTRLEAAGIRYTGGGLTRAEAVKPTVLTRGDTTVGFLAFSDVGPAWLAVGSSTPGILLTSDPEYASIIARAAQEVDILIVSLHFGEEYESLANVRQQTLAHTAARMGASVVVGHHPHVVQNSEVYNGTYIAYSLGNFIFDQNFSKETMEGLALSLTFANGSLETAAKRRILLNENFQPAPAF